MPYIFIWSALVFRKINPDCQITKINQGCIEKHYGSIKHVRGHQAIVSARHVLDSAKITNNLFNDISSSNGGDMDNTSGNIRHIKLCINVDSTFSYSQ